MFSELTGKSEGQPMKICNAGKGSYRVWAPWFLGPQVPPLPAPGGLSWGCNCSHQVEFTVAAHQPLPYWERNSSHLGRLYPQRQKAIDNSPPGTRLIRIDLWDCVFSSVASTLAKHGKMFLWIGNQLPFISEHPVCDVMPPGLWPLLLGVLDWVMPAGAPGTASVTTRKGQHQASLPGICWEIALPFVPDGWMFSVFLTKGKDLHDEG